VTTFRFRKRPGVGLCISSVLVALVLLLALAVMALVVGITIHAI
jgi:hypothetical protein